MVPCGGGTAVGADTTGNKRDGERAEMGEVMDFMVASAAGMGSAGTTGGARAEAVVVPLTAVAAPAPALTLAPANAREHI